MTIEFIDNRNRFFEDVKALGRKNSATLGVMPKGGFEDCVRNRNTIRNFANNNYDKLKTSAWGDGVVRQLSD